MIQLAFFILTIGMASAGKVVFEASQKSDAIVCPDQTSRCSGASTCCQMEGGQWGCCQFSHATCCSDNLHCCPQGYSCNMLKGECVLEINNNTIPWAKKEAAPVSTTTETPPTPEDMVCPDGTSCGALCACCRTYSGSYRCCNYPNNVCCSDGYHCCPRGSVCDASAFRCLPGFLTSDWKALKTTKSTPSIEGKDWSSIEGSK